MPSLSRFLLVVSLLELSLFSNAPVLALHDHTSPHANRSLFRRSPQSLPRSSQGLSGMIAARTSQIVETTLNATAIPGWLSTLGSDGKWPKSEIDYTSGCNAQRGNWPAQVHWQRISTMAAAWAGPLPGATQYQGNSNIQNAISRAMDWWFENDFTNKACLDQGGASSCPCNTTGLWNTNWFSSVLYVPMPVGRTCILMSSVLSKTQVSNCTNITQRTYNTFKTGIHGLGSITGANLLQIAGVGVDGGMFTNNQGMLQDAYSRVHNEVDIQNAVAADGIRPDGSFGQHGGLLYTGNYGKDYINAILQVEIPAAIAGMNFQAGSASVSALDTLMDGSQWMIYTNSITGVEHWDFSTLARMISFPVADQQATGSINIVIEQFQALGQARNDATLLNLFSQLNQRSSTANVGNLIGNRAFWNNDYMVHRGQNYVTTIKGYSSRTLNSECINNENPFGFHLSDGALYTYVQGDEYEDIAAAMDWNLIPGITVDYGGTALNCGSAKAPKSSQSFVGGVSNIAIGSFAMKFTNPSTKSLSWQKSWFFFDGDVQHVVISDISSKSSSVFSVLDQKKHNGPVLIDGQAANNGNVSTFSTLWHSNVGYVFSADSAADLTLSVQEKTGPWSALGISTQPPTAVDIFAAWLHHKDLSKPVSYTIYPGMDQTTFSQVAPGRIITLANSTHVHAAMDTINKDVMIHFYDTSSSVTVPGIGVCDLVITVDHPALVVISPSTWNVSVADPSQTTSFVTLSVSATGYNAKFPFVLPNGGLAGTSVSQNLSASLGSHCPISNLGVSPSSPEPTSPPSSSQSRATSIHLLWTVLLVPFSLSLTLIH